MADDTEEIPDEWKKSVREILRRAAPDSMLFTKKARRDWQITFPEAYSFECNDAISVHLSQPQLTGKRISDMDEPGEVWAFWIFFDRVKLYTKVNLRPNQKSIIVYSCHLPNKGDYL